MAPIAIVPAPAFFEPGAPPRLVPLLIVETDIEDLSPDIVPILHQDIDMTRPVRRVARFATPPPPRRAVSVGPGPLPRASSNAPEDHDSGSGSGDDSSSLSSISSDEEDENIRACNDGTAKICKPPGEVGRPNRGGYKLEDALQWDSTRMRSFKSLINKLVDEHLNTGLSFGGQSERRLHLVRDEAVKRLPDLARYDEEWPVTDAVKQRLKYTSSRARQHVHDALAATAQKKGRSHRD
ncbi:hypothetical protein BD414DRAFT_536439 [Trametes punicea]|nr:hypothetical protein BD414DRAFT_536439 [Trametes punicea]